MAITWDCVDWKNKQIAVKGSISRVKDPDMGITALRYSEPKTKSGRRQVPVLPNMIPVLLAHKERQDAEKAEAGSAWNTQNLVFCSNVGTVIEPRRVCTTMDKITDAAELTRFTFHALRHPYVKHTLNKNLLIFCEQKIGYSTVWNREYPISVYSEGFADCSSLRCREWAIPALIRCE